MDVCSQAHPRSRSAKDVKTRSSKTSSSSRKRESEIKRRKRVAVYNTYTVESKVKASIIDSFRWLKSKLN
ncbi:hypothetical protein LguiA_001024 [Lonicera macranthoides]